MGKFITSAGLIVLGAFIWAHYGPEIKKSTRNQLVRAQKYLDKTIEQSKEVKVQE